MQSAGVLDILGVRYRVVNQDGAGFSEGVKGACDPDHAIISILKGLVDPVARRVLLHEVIHAVTGSLDIPLSEGKVQALAAGLASIPQLKIEPEGI
jgi:hypothetical protein